MSTLLKIHVGCYVNTAQSPVICNASTMLSPCSNISALILLLSLGPSLLYKKNSFLCFITYIFPVNSVSQIASGLM